MRDQCLYSARNGKSIDDRRRPEGGGEAAGLEREDGGSRLRMRGETDGLPKVGAGGSCSGSDMSAVWRRVCVYRTRSRSSASFCSRCNSDIIRDKCKFNGEKHLFLDQLLMSASETVTFKLVYTKRMLIWTRILESVY